MQSITGFIVRPAEIDIKRLTGMPLCVTASIPVVGFNAVLMSEHFGAFFAFGILHAALAIRYIKVICPTCDTCSLCYGS